MFSKTAVFDCQSDRSNSGIRNFSTDGLPVSELAVIHPKLPEDDLPFARIRDTTSQLWHLTSSN